MSLLEQDIVSPHWTGDRSAADGVIGS